MLGTRLNRRELIRGISSAALAIAPLGGVRASGQSAATSIPNWNTELKQLGPNIYAWTQASGPGANNASLSNAGLIVGDDLMAIDALGPPIHAKAFIAAARKTTGKPFGRLVNTHHHRDHTNGNCFFRPAEIVSHEFCRKAVIDQGIPEHPYDDRPQWQEGMNELKLAPPTTTFSDRATYRYGDTVVELIYIGPAHTYGDVMVWLPQTKILFAADLAFFYVTLAGQSGHLSKWLEAVNRVLKMDVDVIVPGHGPVGTKKELAETQAYLELMLRETPKRHKAGMTPGQAAADIDMGRFAAWTNPERNAWNTVRIYAELDGKLTPETDLGGQNRAAGEYTRLMASKRGRA